MGHQTHKYTVNADNSVDAAKLALAQHGVPSDVIANMQFVGELHGDRYCYICSVSQAPRSEHCYAVTVEDPRA